MGKDSDDRNGKDRMKTILIVFVCVIGLISGDLILKKNVKIRKSVSHQEKCKRSKPKEKSVPIKMGCLFILPNQGHNFDLSAAQASSRIANFFTKRQKEHYDAPNEFNVNTNDSPFGESAQKNDPRLKLLVRFNIQEVVNGTKKPGFAPNLQAALDDRLTCEPVLYPLTGSKKDSFWEEIKGKSFSSKESYSFSPKNFLSVIDNFSSQYRDNRLMGRYRLYGNKCSSGVAIPLNFCYSDPQYDLEIHDILLILEERKAVEKIYCKRTSDTSWTLISSTIFKITYED
jgi:hypothetical protein